MKKFTYLKEIDGFRYYVYKPSLLYPYYNGYKDDRHYSLKHKIRMILEQLSGNGYRVYYLETSEQKVGYCVVRYGGGNLKWSGKNDLILGPLRVKQMYQGNGFATKLVHSILFNLEIKYENAYEYISNSNIASIRVAKKNGFKKINNAIMKGFFREVVVSIDGEYGIWCFKND